MSALFVSEANKLKNVQKYLEKYSLLAKYVLELDPDHDYMTNLETDRLNEKQSIVYELKEIWSVITSNKKLLMEEIHILDPKIFKHDMISLQEKMNKMKMKLLFEGQKLKEEEESMVEMCNIFNQKVEEWEKPIKISSKYSSAGSIKRLVQKNNKCKEVKKFMEFVNKSNGHENGWSPKDHQLFIKFRNKYKNIETTAINLNKVLPDISIEEIKQHDAWFIEYQNLKNEMKRALETWRQGIKESQQVSENSENQVHKKVISKIDPFKSDEIREKIALWKAEKEERKQQEKLIEQMKIEQKRRVEEEKRKIDCKIKKGVIKWREERTIKELDEKRQKEYDEDNQKKFRSALANQMIKYFQSQDDMFLAKVNKLKKIKENQPKRRSKSSYTANSDPERILRPTKQWLLRTSRDDNSTLELNVRVPNIRDIPKLKIPEWRKIT